jgi:hypothetical protein
LASSKTPDSLTPSEVAIVTKFQQSLGTRTSVKLQTICQRDTNQASNTNSDKQIWGKPNPSLFSFCQPATKLEYSLSFYTLELAFVLTTETPPSPLSTTSLPFTYSFTHFLPCIQQSVPQQPPSILSDLLITGPPLQLGSLPSLSLALEQQMKTMYSQSQSEEV